MGLRIQVLITEPGRSGGVRAALEHAVRLASDHGMEVQLVTPGEPAAGFPTEIEPVSLERARQIEADVAIATWWRTAYLLFDLPASRHAYFLQNFEERVYRRGEVERLAASLTHALPVAFLTEARWIAGVLSELRPDAPCHHIPNGIDKELFAIPAAPAADAGPLRVLVEGSPDLWYKGVSDALAAVERMREPRTVTLVSPEPASRALAARFDRVLGPLEHHEMPGVYAETDVLVKLSRVEGLFTPPLEAFHAGGTCVVWPVTGHDELVSHLENGVVCAWDDLPGTAAWLDVLARDRELLARLRRGALATARGWPSWGDSTKLMARALEEIVAAPAPSATAGTSALLARAEAGLLELRLEAMRAARELHATRQAAATTAEQLQALRATKLFRARAAARGLLASIRR